MLHIVICVLLVNILLFLALRIFLLVNRAGQEHFQAVKDHSLDNRVQNASQEHMRMLLPLVPAKTVLMVDFPVFREQTALQNAICVKLVHLIHWKAAHDVLNVNLENIRHRLD